MGFSTIMDIIGSFIIGGLLFLLLWKIDDASVANIFNNGEELILQQNLATTAMVLENDFRKIGYCSDWNKIPAPSKAILSADSTSIKFLTDVDDDGNVDTIHYYLGPTSELASTPNPRDRFLYRVVNNEIPRGVNLGVTQFKMIYFDPLGDTLFCPIIHPTSISSIEINITVENVVGYGGSSHEEQKSKYSKAFWRQIRLAARNLGNR